MTYVMTSVVHLDTNVPTQVTLEADACAHLLKYLQKFETLCSDAVQIRPYHQL